jgi:hypothetical protein
VPSAFRSCPHTVIHRDPTDVSNPDTAQATQQVCILSSANPRD